MVALKKKRIHLIFSLFPSAIEILILRKNNVFPIPVEIYSIGLNSTLGFYFSLRGFLTLDSHMKTA